MTDRMRFPGSIFMIASVAFAVLAVLAFVAGCGREAPTAQEQMPMHDHASAKEAKTMTGAMDHTKMAAEVEQTTCPVMGGAIDKALFVEYQGKKVYFCCAGCPDTFKADPAMYIAKLPQFQK